MADFYPADVGREIVASGGLGIITGYTNTTTVTVQITQAFPATAFNAGTWQILGSPQATCTPNVSSPVGAPMTLTLSAGGWRPEDVGKFVRINGGLCRITSIASDTQAAAVIETVLTSVVAAPARAWTLEGSAWGPQYGYPCCGTIYEQRLWQGGSPAFPQGLWGSVIGEYLDNTIGTLDDEAIGITVGSGESTPILHLSSARGLVVHTAGGIFSVRGGQEKAITPTNLQVRDQSNVGAAVVAPVRMGAEILQVQRANRKLRAISPNQYDDGQYVMPDLAVLSEHVTESGVTALAYQDEPDSIVYAVRGDGQMATLTADRDQDVFAWSRQVTQGAFEDVETVPTPDGCRVFAIVARTVGGVTTRYVEMFDPSLLLDCAVTGTSDVGATVWGGFGHLVGRTVMAKADGVYQGEFVVNGAGQITLGRSAFRLEAGLPYTTTVKTLTPEFMSQSGSAQGAQLSVHEVLVRLLGTIGCRINLQNVTFRNVSGNQLDRAIAPYTGLKKAGNLGWSAGEAQTLIQQTLPYPFHLLSVITKLTANEG